MNKGFFQKITSPKTLFAAMVLASVSVGQADALQFDQRIVRPKEIGIDKANEVAKVPVRLDPGGLKHLWANYEVERRLARFYPDSGASNNNRSALEFKYSYNANDEEKWLKLLLDTQTDDFAKMCASIMIYAESMDAQTFLSEILEGSDRRQRLNGALALCEAAKQHAGKPAEMANRRLVEFMHKQFVDSVDKDWDHEDLGLDSYRELKCFLTVVVRHLERANEERIIPVLLAIAEHDRRLTSEMIGSFCNYKTDSACKKMVEAIQSCKFDSVFIAKSLAKKGYKPAVPVIAKLLGTDLQTNSMRRPDDASDDYEQRQILRVLLDLNDKRALPAIEDFIESSEYDEAVIVAKRLIVHLSSDDPVGILLEELDPLSEDPSVIVLMGELFRYKDERILKKVRALCQRKPLFMGSLCGNSRHI